MSNKILFVSAHPDDETLGCGGTILKYKDEGCQIFWLITTNKRDPFGEGKAIYETRQVEIKKVSDTYGFSKLFKLDFPSQSLDEIPRRDIIGKVSEVIKAVEPHTIFVPNRSDAHSDHRNTFESVYSCTKNFRYPFVKRVLMYETMSETEFSAAIPENAFTPNVFIDVTKYGDEKLEIMKNYESEVMEDYFPRSINAIKAQMTYRGSRIGKKYAEAFILVFEIID